MAIDEIQGKLSHAQHHCPECHKMNDKRCFKKGHWKICEKHGSKSGTRYHCVKCKHEEERAAKQASKENEPVTGGNGGNSSADENNNNVDGLAKESRRDRKKMGHNKSNTSSSI